MLTLESTFATLSSTYFSDDTAVAEKNRTEQNNTEQNRTRLVV